MLLRLIVTSTMSSSSEDLKEWNNYKRPESGMDKYGQLRMKLALFIRDNILNKLGIQWTIENGTLLGAWRSGKFIPHDDDFDIVAYFEEDAKPQLPGLLEKIESLLPPEYKVRLITTYTDKFEIFDPSYGGYVYDPSLSSPKDVPVYPSMWYNHVTVDIQPFQRAGDVYRSLYRNFPRVIEYRRDDVFPVGKIMLEGEEFHAPCRVEAVLKSVYGSLSPTAKYNKELGLYVDQD